MATKSEASSASSQEPSPRTKPDTSPASETLTPSETESLRREAKETSAFAQKAYAHLRPKKAV